MRLRKTKSAHTRISRIVVATALALFAASEARAQRKLVSVAPREQEAERRIVVSIPDRKLALIENGRVVKIYPIAVGAPSSPSPAGEFKVVNRLTNPTYYSPGVEIPMGNDNPLGTRWMGLSRKSFGIHGTNEPKSIGRNASHGCIRMRNRDAEELFELVRVGDTVELIGERTVELAAIFGTPALPAAKPASPAAPVVVATVVVP